MVISVLRMNLASVFTLEKMRDFTLLEGGFKKPVEAGNGSGGCVREQLRMYQHDATQPIEPEEHHCAGNDLV